MLLFPLFSPACDHVGWLQPGRFVFDLEMAWVAFLTDTDAFSAASGQWIGPVRDGNVFDRHGLPVVWTPGQPPAALGMPARPMNSIRPVRPARPVRPVSPIRPLAPPTSRNGWSALSFADWPLGAVNAPAKASEVEVSPPAAEATPAPIAGMEGAGQRGGKPSVRAKRRRKTVSIGPATHAEDKPNP